MTISKIVIDHYIEDPFVKAWIKSSDIVYSLMTCLNFKLQVHGLGHGRLRRDSCITAVAVYEYCRHSTEGTVVIGGLGCYQMVPFLTEG